MLHVTFMQIGSKSQQQRAAALICPDSLNLNSNASKLNYKESKVKFNVQGLMEESMEQIHYVQSYELLHINIVHYNMSKQSLPKSLRSRSPVPNDPDHRATGDRWYTAC